MSGNQFGLALAQPSRQTLLPIMMPSGKIYGFFPIAAQTFAGTETTYALAEGSVPVTTVTLPPKNLTNIQGEQRVEQFMVAQWSSVKESLAPWRGYAAFIDVAVPNVLGYYAWWSMPVTSWFRHFGKGVYLDSLSVGMALLNPGTVPTEPPTVVTPQVLTWATSMDAQSFATDCAFFDFRWDLLFETAVQADPTQQGNGVIPLSISTVSNPPGGFFKASVVQGGGGQTIVPGGGVVFNTVRILRLQDPAPGTYTFDFAVSDNLGRTTPAVLTLTVT